MKHNWIKFLPVSLRAKFEGRDDLQNVVSNTGWQFADHALRMGVGLLVGILVARYLGPEQFGLLSYALAFFTLFSSVSSVGLDDIIVRDIVSDPGRKEAILGTAFFLKVIGGTITFVSAVGTILFLRSGDGLSQWLVGIIAAGAIFQAGNVIEFWFHSQVKAKYAVIARNTTFLLCSLAKIFLVQASAPLIAFAWIATLEILAGSAALAVVYRWRGNYFRKWQANFKVAKALLKSSWPLMLSGSVVLVYLRIDQVMLGEMVGNEEVGIYSVAVRLAEVWLFIPTAIYWSVFPSIVEAKGINEDLFYGRLQKFYNLVALAAYAVALPVTFLGQWLVPTLFGEAFARGGLMLAVLIWSNVFIGLEYARSSFLTAMDWTRIHLVTVVLGCLLNIALNYLLIPRYGGMGAVLASVAAYWFSAHGTCFLFRPLFRTGAMLTRALFYPKIF